jgi:hypothetical protein
MRQKRYSWPSVIDCEQIFRAEPWPSRGHQQGDLAQPSGAQSTAHVGYARGIGHHESQSILGQYVCWYALVDPDSKMLAFSLDPEEHKRTTAKFCLSNTAEILAIVLTVSGKVSGLMAACKRILDELAFVSFIPEMVLKCWGLSGKGGGLKIASCILKCFSSCLPLLRT